MTPFDCPRATYRLQLHQGFTLADAEAQVPYLAGLGVSHLYLSPILMARAGSTHGYDIVDHARINPELGGMPAMERLAAAARAHGLGIVVDIVPNHMGVGGADNAWWLDVLEWGEDSPFARYFDIDWLPARRELRGKLLLPFLGDHYGAVLERGELVPRLDRAAGALDVWYWDHRHPLTPRDYSGLLRPAVAGLGDSEDADRLADVVDDFSNFTDEYVPGRNVAARRQRATELKRRLAAVAADRPAVAEAVDAHLAALAGDAARLHALLERQHWRISYWRVAADEINYRRFFDINDLAALRMVEEPELFARAHRLVFELIARGMVQGLRVDHVDGLFNPAEYCRMLQAGGVGPDGRPPFLVVEKILARHEPLRRDWPVAGTTGYDFTNLVCGLFVDAAAEPAISAAYQRFTATAMDFEAEVVAAKRRIVDEHMTSELRVLAGRLGRIAASHWRSRDFTLSGLYHALAEVVAWLPVYRTYVTSRRVTDTDRRYLDWAVAKARRASAADPSLIDFVAAVLDTSLAKAGGYSSRAIVDFAMRFQQFTGPVMAKGFEDTALYRYNRLLALNEVGGDPTRFGVSPSAFLQAVRARARRLPHAMLATATHDTKRGEDTRLRIAALSEFPEDWRRLLERGHQLNAPFRRTLEAGPAPEPNDEYWIYQTLFGAFDADDSALAERMAAAAVKAAKEAKRRTSWAHPDEAYETALAEFVHRILETGRRNPFRDDLAALHRRLLPASMLGGLAQTLLKLTLPGVPDIFQGTELWDLSLVDPDNRRPVDFALRAGLAGRPGEDGLPPLPALWLDGGVKQELIRRTLELRRRLPDLFAEGACRPLAVRGPQAGNLVAFVRHHGDAAAVAVVVPVLAGRLWGEGGWAPGIWRGTAIEAPRRVGGHRYRDLLSGREVTATLRRGTPVLAASDLLAGFPMALLESAPDA
ncbi:malto-oligosyltrehalose synthase [Magnetospirillum sp. UT-4]|uniref:malto-oligosyltrehalose synthase n=1 Tax=Magnetospirillum sp. UT-4 TaxID=2681467 RepID=UPI001384FFC0|nr:malto-oligosyltrehalose synthase [Magnetospirillum sp. UT-4]CAA7619811.1 Malto-oligosyltrehalose synthase [Magnetospirillum sp. UT-4]